MDWVAVGALVTAAAALLKVFWPASSKSLTAAQEHRVQEVVDNDVLTRFLGLADKVTKLELELAQVKLDLAEAKQQLAQALLDMAEMQKVEEYLRASLHEKDQELRLVRRTATERQKEIEGLRGRVRHLEEVCRRAGINGDEEDV